MNTGVFFIIPVCSSENNHLKWIVEFIGSDKFYPSFDVPIIAISEMPKTDKLSDTQSDFRIFPQTEIL